MRFNYIGRSCGFLMIFLLFISFSTGFSDEKTDQVDALFAQWDKTDSPGCALAIIQNGRIIYKRGYGMANLELDVPISPQSVFYIGSVSKQFVSASIGLLAIQGKLDLDEDIRKYVPEIPEYDTPITIRHLIHHTSGMRDYLTLLGIASFDYGTYHEQDVLDLIARQKELNFKPGEEHLYSNSGYFMLSVIVQRASGKTLREFADEFIFKPLGMNNSRFHDDYMQLIKNRATGYFPSGKGQFRNFISTFDNVGSGGLFTSVEDLLLWDQNFYSFSVGGRELYNLMHTKGKLNSGAEIDYAFAIDMGIYKGLKIEEHGGALGGYRSALTRFPEQNFSVVILSNLSSANPSNLAYKVADIYLSDFYKDEQTEGGEVPLNTPVLTYKSFEPIDPTPEELQEYTGEYSSDELDVTFKIELIKNRLCFTHRNAPPGTLQTNYKDIFRLGNLILFFSRNENSQIDSFTVNAGRVTNLRFYKK